MADGEEGLYSLVFMRCRPPASAVSFRMDARFYNPGARLAPVFFVLNRVGLPPFGVMAGRKGGWEERGRGGPCIAPPRTEGKEGRRLAYPTTRMVTGPNFLPAGETPLPALYFLFFFCYALSMLSWTVTLRRRRQHVRGGGGMGVCAYESLHTSCMCVCICTHSVTHYATAFTMHACGRCNLSTFASHAVGDFHNPFPFPSPETQTKQNKPTNRCTRSTT